MAFLFKVKDIEDSDKSAIEVFKKDNAANVIYDHHSYGPTFGNGHNLHICNNCNVVENSNSNMLPGYKSPEGIDHLTYLTGSNKFIIQNYEVF